MTKRPIRFIVNVCCLANVARTVMVDAHRHGRGAMRHSAFLAGMLFWAILEAPSLAETPPAPKPEAHENASDIVVMGMSEKERAKTAQAFVRTLTILSPTDPTARYEPNMYCPVVFGLSDSRNEEIAARMRRVAAVAGVKPALPGCVATAFVFLVDNKKSFLEAFAKKQPVFFDGKMGAPVSEKGPAIAWLLTQDFDPQHAPVGRRGVDPRLVESPVGGSRVTSMITRAVAASVVIVERAALVGLTTTQIADYALMRSLVDPTPFLGDRIRAVSILGVVDAPADSQTPMSLTAWDLGYIKGRYKGEANAFGSRQSSVIGAAIRDEVNGKAKASK